MASKATEMSAPCSAQRRPALPSALRLADPNRPLLCPGFGLDRCKTCPGIYSSIPKPGHTTSGRGPAIALQRGGRRAAERGGARKGAARRMAGGGAARRVGSRPPPQAGPPVFAPSAADGSGCEGGQESRCGPRPAAGFLSQAARERRVPFARAGRAKLPKGKLAHRVGNQRSSLRARACRKVADVVGHFAKAEQLRQPKQEEEKQSVPRHP